MVGIPGGCVKVPGYTAPLHNVRWIRNWEEVTKVTKTQLARAPQPLTWLLRAVCSGHTRTNESRNVRPGSLRTSEAGARDTESPVLPFHTGRTPLCVCAWTSSTFHWV